MGVLEKQDDYYGIAADSTSVWIYNGESGVVTRVARDTNAVTATIQLHPGCSTGRGCGNVAVGDGAVWVANDIDGTITHIDEQTNKVVATVDVGGNAAPHVFTTPGAVWSANYFSDSYSRIDPRTNTVVSTLSHHLSAESVAYVAGSLWLCDAGGDPGVTRLDPGTLSVQAQIHLTAGGLSTFCAGAAPLGGSLYVLTDGNPSPPQVIDAGTGQASETTDPPGHDHGGLVGAANGTWLIDRELGVFRIDAHTRRAAAQLPLAGAAGIADDGSSLWVVSSTGTLSRITPSAVSG